MNNQNLVIYEFDELYKIFFEIKKDINLNFEKSNKEQLSELKVKEQNLAKTLSDKYGKGTFDLETNEFNPAD